MLFAKVSVCNRSFSMTETPQASEQNEESNRGFRLQSTRMQYLAAFFFGFAAIALALPNTVWNVSVGEGIDTGISVSTSIFLLLHVGVSCDDVESSESELEESSSISNWVRTVLFALSLRQASRTWSSSGSKKFNCGSSNPVG